MVGWAERGDSEVTEEVNHEHLDRHEHPIDHSVRDRVSDPDRSRGPLASVGQTFEEQYRDLKAEYHMTIKVLAVLAEIILSRRPNDSDLVISDEALLDCPDLVAWRDPATYTTHIKIKR
jgi:hypothetical protein